MLLENLKKNKKYEFKIRFLNQVVSQFDFEIFYLTE